MIYKDLQNVNIKQPSAGRGGKEKSIERGQTEVKKSINMQIISNKAMPQMFMKSTPIIIVGSTALGGPWPHLWNGYQKKIRQSRRS